MGLQVGRRAAAGLCHPGGTGVGAIILLFLGINPIEAYSAMLEGAFGSANALAETLVKATPLLLVASVSAFPSVEM